MRSRCCKTSFCSCPRSRISWRDASSCGDGTCTTCMRSRSPSRLALELFWREFSNRRQVGACVGLVPQPYDSGESQVDQGISKQGNRRVRALLIEMAWTWLRYQPDSALTQWFNQRPHGTGPNRRARRIAIVAVARRLAIALWRYLKDGVIPEGAHLKPA